MERNTRQSGKSGQGKIIGSEEAFREFLSGINTPKLRSAILDTGRFSEEEIDNQLAVYVGEMLHGYRFVAEHILPGKLRILEVGAGLGLMSIYLHRLGHEVVALEPAALAFGFFEVSKKEIWKAAYPDTPALSEKTAEELTPEIDGKFDFIFSMNVMEHIADINKATAAILGVLENDGICVNSCPNYLVPYEPHYAIPMVPFAHSLTRKIYNRKIAKNPDIWDSLNFINWFSVRRMARQNGATVTFESGLIYKSFKRLGEDEEFMARHRDGLVGKMFKILSATRLLGLLRFLPPIASTPMIFTYRLKK